MSTRVSTKQRKYFRLAMFISLVVVYLLEGAFPNLIIVLTGLPIMAAEFFLRSAYKQQDSRYFMASLAYLACCVAFTIWYHLSGIFVWPDLAEVSSAGSSPVTEYGLVIFTFASFIAGVMGLAIVLLAYKLINTKPGHNQ